MNYLMVDKHPHSANGTAKGFGQINSIFSEEEQRRELTLEERLARPLFRACQTHWTGVNTRRELKEE